ncbi:hypothetical protein NFI96_015883, partial [Prochilodus magdalenae]
VRGWHERAMAPLGVPAPWLKAALLLLLLLLPACLSACPRSCSCPNPKEVHCTFRHLPSSPRNLPKDTERLNLGYNSIVAVGPSDFENLRQLEMLMLHGNDINSVASGSFYHLRYLQILKLSYNKLKSIDPSMFEGLTSLVRLHLDHNLIGFIEPFSFNGLTSLKLLQLEGNKLQDLHPHTFTTLSLLGTFWGSGLRHLHLADNLLEYLQPSTLQHLSRLEVLSLHGNPWTCDCHLRWLLEWNKKHEGIIKCKKDRDSAAPENCAMCASPQPLNNSQIFQISAHQLSCDRPTLQSPLKIGESSAWDDQEPDSPYVKDLEHPLGHLTFMLSDSHGNRADVACKVTRPGEETSMVWEQLRRSEEVAVNVTLLTLLECEIDRDALQNLWRLVAYYYESPAVLERGAQHDNTSKVTFQYSQTTSEDSPYFTELKGHLMAEPAWLLQPRVTLQLNRRKTTTKKLVLNFSTFITKHISGRGEQEDAVSSWALIRRGAPGRIRIVLEHSDVTLECDVLSSGQQSVEWMLPDLTTLEKTDSQRIVSEHHRLIIKNTSLSDTGLYHCFVRTETDVDIVSYRLTVRERLLSPSDLNGKKMTVENGQSLSLPCSVTSPHPIEARWYRQSQLDAYRLAQLGKLVTPKPRIYQPTLRPYPTPDFPSIYKPVTPTSAVATSSKPHTTASILYGSRWHYSHLGVKKLSTALPFPNLMGSGAKPRIITTDPVTVSALAEANVVLPCQASGDPKPAISWTKVSTGATIQANTKHGQRFEVLPNGTFVIKNVQLQDRGQYLCAAQNKFGSDRMVVTLAIQTEPPKIEGPKYRHISVYLWKPFSLDCIAAGKPQAQVSWILPDKTFVREVEALNRTISLFPNGTLSIHSANFSSKGDYKCIASNAAGADTLTYHLHITALPPTIKEEALESISISNGRSIYVHCTAKGEPAPLLKWALPDGSQMKPTQFIGRRLFIFPNGTLYINSVTPADTGKYECSVSNTVGFAKRVVDLNIKQESKDPWKGPSQQHIVSAQYGSTVYLHCPESTGSHRGTIWRLPSKILLEHRYSPQRHITAFPNGTLRILQLAEKDGGSYLCMYQRPNGEDMELFQVEVLMKPPKIKNMGSQQKRVTNGENFLVDCVASGLPDPEVSWSLPDGTIINNALQSDDSGSRSRRYIIFGNGTLLLQQMGKNDEGDYTCYAKNTLGEDAMKVSVQVVPNSPRISSKDQVTLWAPLGQAAQMTCDATGEPPPTIIWISPNNEIITSSVKYQILNEGTLIIHKVTLADQGKYACVARNSAGDDIKNVKLQVEVREPHINGKRGRTESKVLAVSYQTLLLHCKAEGMPEPQIMWTTSYGLSLHSPYVGGRFQVHRNGTLELRGVRKTDEGQFVCVAKNYLGEASLAVDLEVASLAEKPSFPMPNIEVLPLKPDGDDITLECRAIGKPKPEFVWILPNSTVLAPGMKLKRFIHSLGNGTLHIIQPVPSDKGVYRCLAKNVAGQAEKRYALEPGRKPQIRGTAAPVKTSFGHTLNMPCTVDGWPQATITWTLPNGLVLDRPQVIGRVTYLSNGTLQLREAAKFDRGTYVCKATNTFGSSTISYPVTIMVFAPQITNAPPSITRVTKGSPVTLNCIATGIPKPEISWTLPGRTTLVPSNRFTALGGIHMTEQGSLIIQDPSLMNSGIYKCNAKNALGMDFKATYLQVI